MRNANNFHPEWGYLAPSRGFKRTARVVIVATAIGATIGAGVVFSLVAHPATDSSVSMRTLVRPAESGMARVGRTGLINSQSATRQQSPSSQMVADQWADVARDRSRTSAPRPAPEGITASADAATATDGAPAKIAAVVPVAVVGAPVSDPAPIKMKSTKTFNVASRYASRGKPLRLAPGGNHLERSSGEYDETGARFGNYRDGPHWGGWPYWDGGRPYQDW